MKTRSALAAVDPKRGTPIRVTLVTAVLLSVLAGIVRLDEIAALLESHCDVDAMITLATGA